MELCSKHLVLYYRSVNQETFSQQLEHWLKSSSPKTIRALTSVFAEKSFAIVVLVLMFLPALPLPTGGITHIFELIVMLLSIELMLGKRTIWLPNKWNDMHLGKAMQKKLIPFVIKRIEWFERHSKPRLGEVINHPLALRFLGLIFFLFALGAFLAPPFAGLDTLPSMGAVIVALSLILGDIALLAFGCLVGAVGVGIVIGTGDLTIHFIERLIH